MTCAGSACAFPPLPPLEGHSVGGQVSGLWTGANLSLELDFGGSEVEPLVVGGEGPFAFVERLDPTTPYEVRIVANPASHTCSVVNGSGIVADGDVTDVALNCVSDVAVGISLSLPTDVSLNVQQTRHAIDTSLLQTEMRVVVTAPVGASVSVAGQPTPIATPSAPVRIPYGASETVVSISVGELSRDYVLEVDRGAVDPAEYGVAIASNGEIGDAFAEELSGYDDRVVVGAFGEASFNNTLPRSGAVYVYRRNGASWTEEQYIKGTPYASNELFGFSTALFGDLLVVGAHGASIAGSAYVFGRRTGVWQQDVRLTAPVPAASDSFGASVSTDGTTIAVGDTAANRVYIYRWNGSAWALVGTVSSGDSVAGDNFGHRVRVQGDLVLVTAPGESSSSLGLAATPASDNGASASGAMYVFRETSTAAWTLEAFVKATTVVPNGGFGMALDLDGDTVVVGSNTREDVHVLTRAGTTWSQPARLQAAGSTQRFGQAVSVKSDLIVVGEPSISQLHVFRLQGETWLPAGLVGPGAGNAAVGQSTVLLGHGLVAGAPNEDGGMGKIHVLR